MKTLLALACLLAPAASFASNVDRTMIDATQDAIDHYHRSDAARMRQAAQAPASGQTTVTTTTTAYPAPAPRR